MSDSSSPPDPPDFDWLAQRLPLLQNLAARLRQDSTSGLSDFEAHLRKSRTDRSEQTEDWLSKIKACLAWARLDAMRLLTAQEMDAVIQTLMQTYDIPHDLAEWVVANCPS